FYPHHLVWTKSNTPPPGYYTPNPIHIEKFVVNPDKINASANTKITLTVGDDMTISDSLCKSNFGKSQTQPTSGPGVFLAPGDVGYFDWWACTSPALFCTGADTDTLKFTATCGICPPGFLNSNGDPECDQQIIIDCAETDLDAPEFSDTLQSGCHSTSINVHDWRATDRGLSTVTWVAASGTDASKFVVSAPVPAIKPCYTDKLNHIITITKLDSTASGCFDFTFTDCLGHQSFHTACLSSCVVIPHPDSLAPVFSLVKKWGTYDSTFTCDNGFGDNNRIDSFLVTDNRKNDSGICVLAIVPGSDSNMDLNVSPFSSSSPLVRFSVSVQDSMKDGNICIRATDCAKPIPHYTDTCIHYCTIKDTLAPRISITKAAKAGIWFVEVKDDTAWDRRIDSIYIITSTPLNISINGNGKPYVTDPLRGLAVYPFTVTSDSTKVSDFCIEALDLAGNRTPAGAHCGHQGISRDSLCPNIIIDPPVNKNPVAVMVNVNDIHFDDPPKDSIRYIWDTGVDSVWFEGNHGMIVPPPISGKGADTIAAFPISVRDTMAVDSIPACVTIYAKDMNGNICYATYCYPYTQDIFPPVITLWYDKKDTSIIHGVVTDSTINDRGLFNIASGPSQNLIDSIYRLTKDPIKYFTLKRNSIGESTTSLVSSLDWAGSISPLNAQLAHTATVPFNIWVQDFAMRKGIQPDQGSVFYIPVHFVKNDSIPVVQKGITDFTFSFTMSGDLKSIIFDSVSTRGTEAANWTVTSTPPGSNPVIVVGKSNGGPLTADLRVTDPNKSDSLVLLYFHAQPSQSTYHVDISIDSIRFNNGRDTLYTGTSSGTYISSALMPAPYGILGGSTIVISGACAPKLQTDNIHPTSVSLDPNHPNPFSHITTFNYTVAEEGPVKFYIYDALGKVITRIVDQSQKQGAYTVTFDASSISGGTYVARLETGGTVVSRRVSVEK
ncbi:MAG: T9SS type A sorting domain-containing protein, partial [Bacteroidota bacterium]|nr:T9SS type A sorting domain-containing protein [Bacteroidota bacterium]